MVAAAKRRGFGAHCQPLEIRFWTKVRADVSHADACWLWAGGKDGKGYPILWHGGRARGAHRISWELRNAKPFPDGMQACHKCDTPLCVRPDHIFPGTGFDNMQDALRKGRAHIQPRQSHCQRGHEMVEGNIEHNKSTGKRSCRTCRNLMAKLRYAEKRSEP